jgi:hypothetical protein
MHIVSCQNEAQVCQPSICRVCGELTFKYQSRNFTPVVRNAYELYFACKVGNQDKSSTPYVIYYMFKDGDRLAKLA